MLPFSVLTAVYLNDQFRIYAGEIDYVASDRDLPAKLPAFKLPVPQMPPYAPLCLCLFLP
jgi:hypothetical protein